MDKPRIPAPTVCTHPRNLWETQGSSSWGTGVNAEGKRVHRSEHQTLGWTCRGCGVWITNENPEREVYERVDDERSEPTIVRWG